jgi:hypothetical protein
LPCRRSWVRVPSSALRKALLSAGFSAWRAARGSRERPRVSNRCRSCTHRRRFRRLDRDQLQNVQVLRAPGRLDGAVGHEQDFGGAEDPDRRLDRGRPGVADLGHGVKRRRVRQTRPGLGGEAKEGLRDKEGGGEKNCATRLMESRRRNLRRCACGRGRCERTLSSCGWLSTLTDESTSSSRRERAYCQVSARVSCSRAK